MFDQAAFLAKLKKGDERRTKKKQSKINEIESLAKVPKVILDANYVNPVTLEFPRSSTIVYEIKNRTTGRKDYYDVQTFWKLVGMVRNNYKLLMMNPKSPIPGARNPVTRGAIYPRNVRRVTVKAKKTPTKSAAARKIQSAVRAHLKKKKAAKK
jgi:hypothetical protein